MPDGIIDWLKTRRPSRSFRSDDRAGYLTGRGIYYPSGELFNGFATAATMTAGQYPIATIGFAARTGRIDQVAIRTGTVTTGATFTVAIETVNPSTGAPTGNLVAPGATGTLTVADSDDSTLVYATINTPPEVKSRDLFAITLRSPIGSPSWEIGQAPVMASGRTSYSYYGYWYTGGSFTRGNPLLMWFRYKGETNLSGFDTSAAFRGVSGTSGGWNDNQNPDERGYVFDLPFAATVRGFWILNASNGTSLRGKLYLYNASGSDLLAEAEFNPATTAGPSLLDVPIQTPGGGLSLARGRYLVAIKPTSGSPSVSLCAGLVSKDIVQYAMTRNDGGAWTPADTSTTVFQACGLILA